MNNREAAVMAMIGISAVGLLMADGERCRLKWVQAMRRCLLRLSDAVRFEQPDVKVLLCSIDLRATQQERELSKLLRLCGRCMEAGEDKSLRSVFEKESVRMASMSVLSKADKSPFAAVISELGRFGLHEQLRLIEEADERLRRREEALRRESAQRARMMGSLGLCAGIAAFLVLI